MEIKLRLNNVQGRFETDTGKIECVEHSKYDEVKLCFKGNNANIPFARIKLHSSNLAIHAKAVFKDAANLGHEIAKRWNEYNPKKKNILLTQQKMEILNKNAKKYMLQWNIEAFKQTHPRLLHAIMESMDEINNLNT